jgi:hypothetical protein
MIKAKGGCWNPPPPAPGPADGNYPGVAITAIGMGTEPDDDEGGFKRAYTPTFFRQVDNSIEAGAPWGGNYHPGSATQLVTIHTVDADGMPIAGEATMRGDSGGPILYHLPDGTWQIIGNLNGDAQPSYADAYEAAPAYLHWIESVTGTDVSPCHDLNDEDEWEWHGACLGDLPISIDQSVAGSYVTDSCSAHTTGGQYCGGWWSPPLDKATGSMPMPNHPWIQASFVEDSLATTLTLANNGDFGDPVDVDAVADYLYDAAYDHSSYSFLANIHDEGEVGVGYLSVAVSASFAGSTAGEYEVFSEPDYDCGKGRIIVVDPTGGRTEWGLDSSGVLGDAACEGYFGADLGVGDFNGDGYDDLAVGSPGAAVGSLSSAGKVHVLYGSATGLTAAGDQMFHQNSTGISGSAHAWTFFAERLTTGDFDCNGSDDLVVGSPRATVGGHYEAGIVHVLYGTTGGLSSVNDLLYEGSAGVGDTPMDHDHLCRQSC